LISTVQTIPLRLPTRTSLKWVYTPH